MITTEAPFVSSTCECGGDMIVDTQFVGYFGDEPAHEPIGSHCCECGRDVDQIIQEHDPDQCDTLDCGWCEFVAYVDAP